MVMEMQKLETMPPPPGVFESLKAGFNVVSNRVILILLPLGLDLFLWLGPRLSGGNLYNALLKNWIDFNSTAGLPVQNIPDLMDRVEFLGLVNLLGWLRTFPVGIPSLFSGILPDSLPLQTPFGTQTVIQVPSLLQMFGWMALLTAAGWVGGGLFFRLVSNITLNGQETISPLRAIIQTFILSLVWWIGLTILLFPVLIVVSLLALINPLLANGAAFIIMMLSFWLIVPLFFMPHGIFIRKQNAFRSIFTSLNMSRFTLPTSSLFVFAVIILSTGLNYLWSVPSNDSWMMLVGIAGHAFITTVLLAASFIYYRDMTDWLKNMHERLQQLSGKPSSTLKIDLSS